MSDKLNGKKKKDNKIIKNDLRNNTRKTKVRVRQTPLQTRDITEVFWEGKYSLLRQWYSSCYSKYTLL